MKHEAADALIAAAKAARANAYAPYSRFTVGAAVLTPGGVFAGCNVENAAFSPTICAERVAASAAVAAGHRDIRAVAIVGGKRRSRTHPISPCGVCRQFLFEFNPRLEVISEGTNGRRATWQLSDLLADGFGPKDVRDSGLP